MVKQILLSIKYLIEINTTIGYYNLEVISINSFVLHLVGAAF